MEQKTYDDLFLQPQEEAQLGSAPQQPEFDKEAWAAKKQEQRQTLFTKIDEMAALTLFDSRVLQRFLYQQGKSAVRYSVTNTLLILHQRPEQSDHVRHEDDWSKAGRGIRRGEGRNAILLFKRDHEYAGDDGLMKTGYNVHRYFDISQTFGPALPKPQQLDLRLLLSALMRDTTVQLNLSENVSKETGAVFIEQEGAIHVAAGMEGGNLFRAVSRELARVQHGGDTSPAATWYASCISNIVNARYGVAPTPVQEIPEDIALSDLRTKKAILEAISHPAMETIRRMETTLQPYRQQQREARQAPPRQQEQPSR